MVPQAFISEKTITYVKKENDPEVNRLFCAAIINKRFRSQLLSHPRQAVANGYQGEIFELSDSELCRLESIRATNLAEFASQYIRAAEPARVQVSVAACD